MVLFVAALFTVISVQSGWAASFSVAPVRVILDQQRKTERLAVKNESDRPLTLQIKAYRWTQTQEGKDRYDEAADLIIFPRALTLAAEEERFIRVGITVPAGSVERAFRIYMEEQPVKEEQTSTGATGRILMRVGIPVFVQPRVLTANLKIKELSFAKGSLSIPLTNDGNTFAMVQQITAIGIDDAGTTVFNRNLGGFYLLAGSSRTCKVLVPKEKCRRITKLSVTTKNDGKKRQSMLNIPFGACAGP